MKCYFLRHGVAVEPEAWTGPDADRPLTRDGRERMQREAKGIEALALGLDRIVTSPLRRAKETAGIVAERLEMRPQLTEETRLAGGFTVEDLGVILSANNQCEAILLVGHEPTMSATIGEAIGNARIELKKAALAGIEFLNHAAGSGTLICLIPPKVLIALGKR